MDMHVTPVKIWMRRLQLGLDCRNSSFNNLVDPFNQRPTRGQMGIAFLNLKTFTHNYNLIDLVQRGKNMS